MESIHRVCPKCGQSKPFTNKFFKPGPKYPEGLDRTCRPCRRAAEKGWRENEEYQNAKLIEAYTPALPPELKRCSRCKVVQPRTQFRKRAASADGLNAACQSCVSAARRKGPYVPPSLQGVPEGHKRCSACQEVKPATTEFFNRGAAALNLESRCIPCKNATFRTPEASARRKALYAKNPERFRQLAAQGRRKIKLSDPERYTAMRAAERQRAKEKDPDGARLRARVATRKRYARKKGAVGTFTAADIEAMLIEQRGCCSYCRMPMRQYHIEHIIPLSRGGGNGAENLALACPTCNQEKSWRTPEEWTRRWYNGL